MLINGFVKHDGFLRRGGNYTLRYQTVEGINRPMFLHNNIPYTHTKVRREFNYYCYGERLNICFL